MYDQNKVMHPKVEIVDIDTNFQRFIQCMRKAKLVTAIILDLIDVVLANIPIINTAWDIVTFYILRKILKNKSLANVTLIEVFLPGIPVAKLMDALLPLATVVTIIDIIMDDYIIQNKRLIKKFK